MTADPTGRYVVDLPGGGQLTLQDAEEVQLWTESCKRYIEDYGITKANDLQQLGALLTHSLQMYRAQRDLAGGEGTTPAQAQARITAAGVEIRAIEKALGIDRKARESGGQHTVQDYVARLKRAANEKGVHIAGRVKAYEQLAMEARWKIRLLRNGDDEDRQYHGLSAESFITWLEGELAQLEAKDQEWARTKGRVFIGKL